MNGNKHKVLAGVPVMVALLASCGDPQSPGLEYMPDMYRGPAVEAYVDYGQDPFYFGDSLAQVQRNTPSWRTPPAGTIPFAADEALAAYNFPYPYGNDTAGYGRAGRELHSPIAMTLATVDQGKVIFDKFCVHCHGATGMGDGSVVAIGGHPPPMAFSGPLKDLPEGRMYHTLIHGKGMMGSHASQLDPQERWLVIQFVKYLQNGGRMTRETAPAMAGGAAAPAPASAMSATPN